MKAIFSIFQLIVSISLIVLILLQAKGVGLGKTWGGSGEFYKSRRGVEKIIFSTTVFLGVIFLISSILTLLFS